MSIINNNNKGQNMAFELIKTLSAKLALPTTDLALLEQVAHWRDITLLEAQGLDLPSKQITPDDYSEWLDAIVSFADTPQKVEKLKTSPSIFNDIAFHVLDNDPKMDLFGSDEETKSSIASALWNAYQAQIKHENISNRQPPTEENEEKVDTKGDDLMSQIHNSVVLQKVYNSAVAAGQNDAGNVDSKTRAKSKYVRGCTRDKVWKLGYAHGSVTKASKKK